MTLAPPCRAQAGTPGEREQRVVNLTAQLLAARSREAAAEQRAGGLLVRTWGK